VEGVLPAHKRAAQRCSEASRRTTSSSEKSDQLLVLVGEVRIDVDANRSDQVAIELEDVAEQVFGDLAVRKRRTIGRVPLFKLRPIPPWLGSGLKRLDEFE